MWILSSNYPELKIDQNVILTGNIIKCYFFANFIYSSVSQILNQETQFLTKQCIKQQVIVLKQ